jgi:oxygen-independent coproporphyrinogen-3 oxidase
MSIKVLKNNSFTPIVSEKDWHAIYPEVDREYIWSYPLIHGPQPFNPLDIVGDAKVPLVSYDTVVYIHVPACLFRCPMCPFYVELVKNRDDLLGYADAVIKELRMYSKANVLKKLNLKTIYFGGGTASLLYPEDIGRIINNIKELIPHKTEVEITVEAHPSVVNYNYLSAIRAHGVNRVSFGIQSFKEDTLKILGLKQTPETNRKALENAIRLGFKTVSADLLYRTPGQTFYDLEQQLKEFLSFGITSLSAYSLELSVREGNLKEMQPDENIDQEMFYLINDTLTELGWHHTAQPDYSHSEHIHQETIVTWKAPQGQTIGLGAGSCSAFNGVNYYNVHDIKEYLNVISEGCLPILTGQAYTLEDAMSRYPVLGARCFNILGKPFKDSFGINFIDVFGPEVRKLEEQGLVKRNETGVEVTKKGKYYVDNISKTFYSLANRCHLQPWGEKMKGAVAASYLHVE